MNACKSRAGRLRLGTSAEFSILEIQLSPFFFAIFSKKYLQKTLMRRPLAPLLCPETCSELLSIRPLIFHRRQNVHAVQPVSDCFKAVLVNLPHTLIGRFLSVDHYILRIIQILSRYAIFLHRLTDTFSHSILIAIHICRNDQSSYIFQKCLYGADASIMIQRKCSTVIFFMLPPLAAMNRI